LCRKNKKRVDAKKVLTLKCACDKLRPRSAVDLGQNLEVLKTNRASNTQGKFKISKKFLDKVKAVCYYQYSAKRAETWSLKTK
jgi:hypothetical protein